MQVVIFIGSEGQCSKWKYGKGKVKRAYRKQTGENGQQHVPTNSEGWDQSFSYVSGSNFEGVEDKMDSAKTHHWIASC